MPRHDASELAIRLGREAEAVCRHYLSSGHRAGRYWLVGDVQNTPGRSMFVRLTGPDSGKGAAGKWTDMATGEHGDLLDVIQEALGLADFRDVAEEARRFLALPHPEPEKTRTPTGNTFSVASGSPEALRRLFAMAQPIRGTLAEIYLSGRAITSLSGTAALRFHPRCYYRPDDHSPTEIRPALVAAVTDLAGHQTGAHRTWLAPDGSDKAAVETPRIVGVDRLDYSKGLRQRIEAFERFLLDNPARRDSTMLLQIAPDTRSDAPGYETTARDVTEAVRRVNARFGRQDRTPVCCVRRALGHSLLSEIYRIAKVGLVTPLRDGMNLVAKEYVACQDPSDPGVLVLLHFAGAASELKDAVLVNPYDQGSVADAIVHALTMPIAERQNRHARMMARLMEQDISKWSDDFLAVLEASQ